jgi:fatty acid desaturase
MSSVEVTDRLEAEPVSKSTLSRLGLAVVNDPRDLPFLRLIVLLTAIAWPAAIYLAWPGNFRWWLAVPYFAMYGFFLGPFILMLHNTSHRKLFNKRFSWLNVYVPWVLGPLFGESPETYNAHHVGMHHHENNLPDDLSSTMSYQRDSAVDFARYFGRFFFLGLPELVRYFVRNKRQAMLRRTIVGELAFYVVTAALFAVSWRAALVVLVIPFVATRFAMMAGNWAQHAFIDATDPGNSYRNSITCINCGYNRRCFNDGYHIGHHVKRTRHWTELPGDFVQNQGTYVTEGSIVFEGVDFFALWFFLMLKRYDWLSARFVDLHETKRTKAQIEELLRARTRAFPAVAIAEAPAAA